MAQRQLGNQAVQRQLVGGRSASLLALGQQAAVGNRAVRRRLRRRADLDETAGTTPAEGVEVTPEPARPAVARVPELAPPPGVGNRPVQRRCPECEQELRRSPTPRLDRLCPECREHLQRAGPTGTAPALQRSHSEKDAVDGEVASLNQVLAEKLGWGKHFAAIVAHFVKLGYLRPNQHPTPLVFAAAVKRFQGERKLGGDDGKLGPGTWKQLRRELGLPATPEEALWEMAAPWEKSAQPVNKQGRVSKASTLYSVPDPRSAPAVGALAFNTSVFVANKGGKGHEGWYQLVTGDGKKGWFAAARVALDPPETSSELYEVKSGDTPINLVAGWYKPKGGFKRDSGAGDARFYVAALAHANQGRAGIPSTDNLHALEAWKSVGLVAGSSIWKPSKEFLDKLEGVVSSGSTFREAWIIAKRVLDAMGPTRASQAAFVAGVLYGPIAWVEDLVEGVVDLGKKLNTINTSIIANTIIKDAQELLEKLNKITLKEIKDAIGDAIGGFVDKFMADDPIERGFFQGKVVGYIITEVAMAILSGGAANAVKWSGKLGKAAKFVLTKLLGLEKKIDAAIPGELKVVKGKGRGGTKASARAVAQVERGLVEGKYARKVYGGQHTIKATKRGFAICSWPCAFLRGRFPDELKAKPLLRAEVDRLDGELDLAIAAANEADIMKLVDEAGRVEQQLRQQRRTYLEVEKGRKIPHQGLAGEHIEDTLAHPIETFDAAKYPKKEGDFVDPKTGKTYDAVGPVPSAHFDRASFAKSVNDHLLKRGVDVVWVDLKDLDTAQTAAARADVKRLVATHTPPPEVKIFP